MPVTVEKTPYPFHLLIKPAGPSCNLRCEYCFYLEKNDLFNATDGSKFKMSIDTLECLLEQTILSQPEGVKEISLGWQGGEPTLNGIDFYRKVIEIEKKICPPGVKISNGFQTNGVLIDEEWADFFLENNILIGLSIDGPKKYHDRYRKDAAGRGSFDRVEKTLKLLIKKGVDVNTLSCIQSDNANHAAEIYKFLKDSGSTFMQFIPIVEPTGISRKPVTKRSVTPGQWGKFLTSILKLWLKEDIGRIFIQHFDSFLGGYMGQLGGLCVYTPTCGRSLAVEHNGNVYSCDHFVSAENLLGNINDTPLSQMVNSSKQIDFGESKYNKLPSYCKNCRYLKLCYGECPKNRLIPAQSGDGNLNYLCSGLKTFYKYSEPYFKAMASALSAGHTASEYRRFLS